MPAHLVAQSPQFLLHPGDPVGQAGVCAEEDLKLRGVSPLGRPQPLQEAQAGVGADAGAVRQGHPHPVGLKLGPAGKSAA